MDDEVLPSSVSPRKSTRNRKSTQKGVAFEIELQRKMEKNQQQIDEEDDDEFSGEEIQIEDTVASNVALAGKDIYSFDRVKKLERLETPKKENTKSIPKTPHHLRKRIGKGIKSSIAEDFSSDGGEAYENTASDYSASESESSNSDSSEDVDVEDISDGGGETVKAPAMKGLVARIQKESGSRTSKKSTSEYVIRTEEYFSNNATKKSTTSNHTLSKLKTPRLNQEELQRLLKKTAVSEEHRSSICNFGEECKDNFNRWICLLHENFNLLFYGLGSKRNVLHEFHELVLKDQPVLVVNGFFPSLTLKDILDAITHDMLQMQGESFANVFSNCEAIVDAFAEIPDQHLYLLVHNIDGDMLRNHKAQAALAMLASARNIHLVASIDHINAPLVWDHNKLSKFNFVWWDCTSFLPYTDETSFESSMMVQRTGNLALSSLRNVFLSLTSNAKGIYKLILKYQLDHNTSQYYQGLLFKDLYWSCREAFLVSSDLVLRAQLTEFVDHKMVKLKRSADGAEYLIIPIATNLLQQFSNEQT
ncbi:PREDICTED: origin recognition complex subunit 2 [Nicrophorus vespilloides]|uniref:Origin recognition complex subunit 2 n=1 Tax=Nicrophorus vespilloides TaxID=110193 RepID=A0ABM1MZZ7_NICVS|nr:PREDICTED: origin recognition complex subunit 2 [Nicrophorus vespilloides]XP_017780148.1 PREDICTED: origin recognition complex subunit 2 [Nicrophorus vespilloides]